MFSTGQKVVCINDQFEPWVYDLYRALPKKDKVYTVRAIAPGRSQPKFSLDDDANLQLTDRQGHTPLQLARSRGHAAMVLMLERAGAR